MYRSKWLYTIVCHIKYKKVLAKHLITVTSESTCNIVSIYSYGNWLV